MRGMFWGAAPTRDMETGTTSSGRTGKKQTDQKSRVRALLSDAAPARRPATFQRTGAGAMTLIGPSYSPSQTIGGFFRFRPHNPEISTPNPDMLGEPQCFLGNVVLVALRFCFLVSNFYMVNRGLKGDQDSLYDEGQRIHPKETTLSITFCRRSVSFNNVTNFREP